jgi:transposase-like protein
MIREHGAERPVAMGIASIAGKPGCTTEMLRRWVRRAERDTGQRAGLATDERQRLKELERELKRAPLLRSLPGRADLPGATDRPVDVLMATGAPCGSGAALRASPARRQTAADHSPQSTIQNSEGVVSSTWAQKQCPCRADTRGSEGHLMITTG